MKINDTMEGTVKRTLGIALALLLAAGCGDNIPPRDAQDDGVEKTQGDILVKTLNASQSGGTPSIIQQVPIGTARNTCFVDSGCGTRYTFNTNGQQLSINNNLFSLSLLPSPLPGSGNDVQCFGPPVLIFNTNIGSLGTSYFPASYGIPANIVTAKFSVVPGQTAVVCQAANFAWTKSVSFGVGTWAPYNNSQTYPGASTTSMQVRYDVDFPEYGVTNRYFWDFK
jgi:hypothetical protein